MVGLTVSLYRVDEIGDKYADVLALRGQWTNIEIEGVRRPVQVIDVRDRDGWVEALIDMTVDLTNLLLGSADVEDMAYPVTEADVDELPDVLFRVIPPGAPSLFPRPPEAVTPNCPMCSAPGMTISSTQLACPEDDCRMFIWNPTKTAAENLANTGEVKFEHNPLDPKSESS